MKGCRCRHLAACCALPNTSRHALCVLSTAQHITGLFQLLASRAPRPQGYPAVGGMERHSAMEYFAKLHMERPLFHQVGGWVPGRRERGWAFVEMEGGRCC